MRNSARVQLHPIDLLNGDTNHGPIGAKNLRHEATARNDVPKLINPNALDLADAALAARQHRLGVSCA